MTTVSTSRVEAPVSCCVGAGTGYSTIKLSWLKRGGGRGMWGTHTNTYFHTTVRGRYLHSSPRRPRLSHATRLIAMVDQKLSARILRSLAICLHTTTTIAAKRVAAAVGWR